MKMTLGLDVSTKSSGFGLFKEKKLVDYGLWKVSDKIEWRERCLKMGEYLSEYLTDNNVDIIYCEDTIGTPNVKTVKQLSTLQGIILGVATAHGVKIEFVSPSTWRSKFGILGGGKRDGKKRPIYKQKTCDYINKTFGLELFYNIDSPSSVKNQDDISDAIGVAYSQIK